MKFSQLFTKTLREAPAEETATNAQLLIRGGFISKNSAGIYSYLPLGWRVIQKIAQIIREEMNAIGGQEMLMQALVEKKYMEPSGRWNLDVGFKTGSAMAVTSPNNIMKVVPEFNFVLGWTHEEVLTAIAAHYVHSYKDLPFAAYQIQTKFRNETRAKSGLLRGREFMMKDLYSFHTTEQDLNEYYEKVHEAYNRVFERCGLLSIYTVAAGGVFTKNLTHEFQVVADVGEDTIFVDEDKKLAVNKEVYEDEVVADFGLKKDNLVEKKSIEVGNIFKQGTKYSEDLGLFFTDEAGAKHPVWMGSYGIGLGRVMATAVEVSHDSKGIVWPESIAPFKVHLIALDGTYDQAEELYSELKGNKTEVLYDNRQDKSAGEKFADADLLGCPIRVVVSKKTLEKDSVEVKNRSQNEARLIKIGDLAQEV